MQVYMEFSIIKYRDFTVLIKSEHLISCCVFYFHATGPLMLRKIDDIDSKKMGDIADHISQIIDIGEIAANAAQVAVPPVVKAIGKGTSIVAEAAKDPSSSS